MRIKKKMVDIQKLEDGSYKFKINNIKQFEDCYFYAEYKDFITLGNTIRFFFKDSQIVTLFKGNEFEYKKIYWMYLEQMILKGENVKY